MGFGSEFKNFFGGNKETGRTQEEAKGRSAKGAVDIAESIGEQNKVVMENAIEVETEEEREARPERQERIQNGLEMLWNRYHMQRGEMKGKTDMMTGLLVKAGVLTQHEAKLDSSRSMVEELSSALDDSRSQVEASDKNAAQIN